MLGNQSLINQMSLQKYFPSSLTCVLSLPIRSLEAEDFRLVVSWGSYSKSRLPGRDKGLKSRHSVLNIYLALLLCQRCHTCWWWSRGSLQCGHDTRTPTSQSERPTNAALRLNCKWTPQKKTPPSAGERCQPEGTEFDRWQQKTIRL